MKIEKWGNYIVLLTNTSAVLNLTMIFGKGNEPTSLEDEKIDYLLNPSKER